MVGSVGPVEEEFLSESQEELSRNETILEEVVDEAAKELNCDDEEKDNNNEPKGKQSRANEDKEEEIEEAGKGTEMLVSWRALMPPLGLEVSCSEG